MCPRHEQCEERAWLAEHLNMNIPEPELQNAERKCNILAEIDEDFAHIIDRLQRKYQANIRVTVIRPVIAGSAGPERIILEEVEKLAPGRQVDR
jgi:hypothetical protein